MTQLVSAARPQCATFLPYRPLGGLRCLLAMMVLAQHGLLLLPDRARAPFYALEMGVIAVSVFFALSGYVVSEALDKVYAGRPGRFLENRLLRILPLYLCVLCMSVTLDSVLYARGHLVALDAPLHRPPWRPAVILSGLFDIVPGLSALHSRGEAFSFIPFAWTLRIELVFYAVAAVWCLLPSLRLREAAGWALGVAVFAAFLVRHTAFPQQVLCIPFFAFGICMYQGRSWRVLLAVAAGAAIAFTYWAQRGHPVMAAQIPVLLILLGATQWLARQRFDSDRFLRWDKRLGALSYPIYLGHGIVLVCLASLTVHRGWDVYAAGLVLSLLFALLLDACIDRPLRALRTRIRGAPIESCASRSAINPLEHHIFSGQVPDP